LQDTYLHVGQDGELTVVDEKGNPLPCQPLIVSPDGSFAAGKIFAYYPGDQTQAALEYYVPPSSSKKGPSP
jgi:hypothetical protein